MSEIRDDMLEDLLRHAEPRPAPSADVEAAARAAVHAEWLAATKAQRQHRSWSRLGIAATFVVATLAGLLLLRPVGDVPTEVATMEKSSGAIFLSSEQMNPQEIERQTILTGQRVVTGRDGVIALSWMHGGSIRVASNTEFEFIDEATLQLRRGKIYFDSTPAELLGEAVAENAPPFLVATQFGDVAHVGTQFVAEVQSDALLVAVREGRVDVDGKYFDASVNSGELVEFRQRRRPVVLSISPYGEQWQWVADSSPAVDVDGRSISAFLDWVSRELGYELRYDTVEVQQKVSDRDLRGTIDKSPSEALRLRMMTTGIDWHVKEGVLHVGSNE